MPWYVARPHSLNWGWHWTMSHFNPDSIDGTGRRQIASWYYPMIGPYDSEDPVVLEYHVLLMKLAGIDGIIVDWYGMDDFYDYAVNDRRTAALLRLAERAGLSFCLCYEDATIQAEIDAGFIAESEAVAHGQQTMRYAQSNYFGSARYLRLPDGSPILLNFGPQYFKSSAQWAWLFSVLEPTNQPAFFTLNNRLSVAKGAFNWPPMHLSQTNGGVLTPEALEEYLDRFEEDGRAWPAFVSSAFPRFHDIYEQAGVRPSYGFLDDDAGETFRSTLTRAMTNDCRMVQIVTWNDFGEGTVVEPTREFEYRDLAIVQDLRRRHLEPDFVFTADDLPLATRLYDLRRRYAMDPLASAEMDRVFTNVVSGELELAGLRLTGLETGRPVIFSLSLSGDELRFSVGGYLSQSGAEVQTTTDPAGDWETVGPLNISTNPIESSVPVSGGRGPAFFRVQTGSR